VRLCNSRRGASNVGLGLRNVLVGALDDDGIAIKVVGHTRQRELAAAKVLEGDIRPARRGLKHIRGLAHAAREDGIEGETLPRGGLFLQVL